MKHAFVLYAPNVHTGGGFVLLHALLTAWPGAVPLRAFLDSRARDEFVLPPNAKVSWVAASVGSRLNAEFGLRKSASAGSTVLCFHGLPPLLPSSARIILFQQNRLYLGLNSLSQFAWKTRLRLVCERFVSRAFRHRVALYVVQTPSMYRAVTNWLAAPATLALAEVKVLPFADALPALHSDLNASPVWDFVYVADGEAHKNHIVLLAAWQLLAAEGLRPSLALTLGARDRTLVRQLEAASKVANLSITNLGQMPRNAVLALYDSARAVIFPSTSESFGLPLVEAAHLGLPILASELDFVRDVCVPVQTFDPASAVSIARAVKRFMGQTVAPLKLNTPTEFWDQLLQDVYPKSPGVLSST